MFNLATDQFFQLVPQSSLPCGLDRSSTLISLIIPQILARFTSKSILVFTFILPIRYQISARLKFAHTRYSDFCKVCEKKKEMNINEILPTHISGMAQGSCSNFECGLPCKFGVIWIRHHGAIDA